MLSGLSASRLIVRSFVGVWRRWRHREKGALDRGWIRREFIGHGAHIDRPEAPRLPAYPRPRGSSRAERGDHVKPWAKWFYKSKAWQKTREAYIAARHGLCERCGAGGKIVHHRVHLTPENIHDPVVT